MSRRIEVELTSRKDDGTWTWRVDAEFDIDGITITNVLPPQRSRPEPERIQLVSPPEPPPRNYADEPAARGRGPRRDGRPDRGSRPGRPPGDRAPRDGGAPREHERVR